ncbi:MAG: type IX secretion system outer membrane channel protein PorV [Bacteroidales bacterium]|nr:type IX secretion system outer membrane channel protein PorV [Bacteroidales bacterium]
MNKLIQAIVLFLMLVSAGMAAAQVNVSGQTINHEKNYISTGIPILMIAPDAVSSAMGDAGVASRPDIYSGHWNNAKFAFIEGDMGVSTTYTPWLRKLQVYDMNLLYLGGYKRINDRSTVAASLTYFSLGEMVNTDIDGNKLSTMMPNEFALDVTYAMKLTNELSLGATGRFITSDLTNGQDVSNQAGVTTTHPGYALAADVGLYYTKPIDKTQEIALGALISNLGNKLSYSDDDNDREFLPSNLRLGGRYSNTIDEYNKVNVLLDFNKLLVPSRPIPFDPAYYNAIGVIEGALMSFGDAPNGFSEELQEIQVSVGAEYWYDDVFALRAGYFFEHENKGGRQYLTLGTGLRYNVFNFDFSYLVPTTRLGNNPLTNTVRITISLNLNPSKNTMQ